MGDLYINNSDEMLIKCIQLWHKCCQHVHMFQAWSNINHKQLHIQEDTQKARLDYLAFESLCHQWRRRLLRGQFSRQNASLFLRAAGFCCRLLCGDPWANVWRTGSASQRPWHLLQEMLWIGASPGQHSCTSHKPYPWQSLFASRAASHHRAGAVAHRSLEERLPWLNQQSHMLLQDPKTTTARTGNSLVLSLEGGWRRGKAVPTLRLPPRMRFVRRFFS